MDTVASIAYAGCVSQERYQRRKKREQALKGESARVHPEPVQGAPSPFLLRWAKQKIHQRLRRSINRVLDHLPHRRTLPDPDESGWLTTETDEAVTLPSRLPTGVNLDVHRTRPRPSWEPLRARLTDIRPDRSSNPDVDILPDLKGGDSYC